MLNIDENKENWTTKWSIIDVTIVFVILILLSGITAVLAPKIKLLAQDFRLLGMEPKLTMFFFAALLQSIFMISAVWLLSRFRRISSSEIGFNFSKGWEVVYSGIGGGIALFCIVVFLGLLVTVLSRTEPPPQEVATYLLAMEGTWPRLLALLLGSVMAPLSEELYFRGMVYPVFRKRFGRTTAIIVSGLLFSLAHRDLFRFIPIAVGGMGLAYLFDRTGSLWTAIIAHATWNTIMYIIMISASRFIT